MSATTARRRGSRPRHRVSVVSVFGELLVTGGVLVLLYAGWQLWAFDLIYGVRNNAVGNELSQSWSAAPAPTPPAGDEPAPEPEQVEPVVMAEPEGTEDFAVMHIPRFGRDYAVVVAGGTTREGTLDRGRIGHYPGSKMPGEVGNFAVAAHRTTYGAPFNRIAELRVGDPIVVETEDGWYTYRFRTLEYVTPSEVEVLLPVPQQPDVPEGMRYLTMTSCSPMYSLAERIVAYSVFDVFTPRSAGPPASLAVEGSA